MALFNRDGLFSGTGTSLLCENDRSAGPECEERVDVVVERIRPIGDLQNLMKEDVREQRAHEEERRGARLFDPDHARLRGTAEVVGDDLETSTRRTVIVARVERHDEGGIRPLVHAEHEVLHDRRTGERHPLGGDAAQYDAGIGTGIDRFEFEDARRQLNGAAHGRVEQGLLRREVPQHRCRGDVQTGGDVGERRGREPFLSEHAACGAQDLLTADDRWPPHL